MRDIPALMVLGALILPGSLAMPLYAQQAPAPATPSPVKSARAGFAPAQATQMHGRFAADPYEAMAAGDVSLFTFLNYSEFQRSAVIARNGPVQVLESARDPQVAAVTFKTALGSMKLGDYLADPRSRVQGVVVVRRGRIVFEDYPGMRPNDYHVWMSTTKTAPGLVIGLLEEQGKIDVSKPLTQYLPWMRGTAWEGVRVIDALDMKTGTDAIENDQTRTAPDSVNNRMNLAANSLPYKGKVETLQQVILAAKRVAPPGQVYGYGSPITDVLVYLAEAVTGRRWPDLFEDMVWSKMGVEGDMLMGVTPDGIALAHGLAQTRLRDLARWGMLFTPSWNKVAREQIVSNHYVADLSKGGDPEAYRKGGAIERYGKMFDEAPVSNHRQWDAVFADGDFYKNGLMGQGLYVSPGKDLVVVFFATGVNDMPGFARAIARHYASAP